MEMAGPKLWRGIRNAIIPSLVLWALIVWGIGAALAQSSVRVYSGGQPASLLNPFPTSNISPETIASLPFTNGQPTNLFVDDFSTGTLNTSVKWNRPTTGGGGNATSATNAVGQTTLGTGTTANGFSLLQTQRTALDRNPAYDYFQTNVNIPIPTVLNAKMLFGFASVPSTPTAAAPCTNAAAFEFGVDGKLRAITCASGTELIVADLSVAQGIVPVQGSTAGTWTAGCNCTPQISTPKGAGQTITDSFKYVIVFRGDNILWYIEQPTGALGLVAFTTRGAVGLDVNQVPITYLAVANTAGPTATATIQVNQVSLGDTGKNTEPGYDRVAAPGQTLTAVNDAVGLNGMGAATCTFTVAANTNVTLVFEATDFNAATWNAVTAYPWGGGPGIQTVPSGTNGAWVLPCAGFNQVRMRVSAIGATPTATVTAEASVATNNNISLSSQLPSASTPITGNAAGSTGAVVGTLTSAATQTAYICGFNVQAIGGTAPVGPITIAGLIGSSQVYQGSSTAAGGTVASGTFTPCIPASAVNTNITITTTADGTATAVDVNSWGFRQ